MPNIVPLVIASNKLPATISICKPSFSVMRASIHMDLCLVCTSSIYYPDYIIFIAKYIAISLIGLPATKQIINEEKLQRVDAKASNVLTMPAKGFTKHNRSVSLRCRSASMTCRSASMACGAASMSGRTASMTGRGVSEHFQSLSRHFQNFSGHFRYQAIHKQSQLMNASNATIHIGNDAFITLLLTNKLKFYGQVF